MSTDAYTRNAMEVTAPIAGQISVLNVNTTAASQDLSLCGPQTVNAANSTILPQNGTVGGCLGRYVRFTANGCSIGLSFGVSNAAVTGSNAPNCANVGVNGATCCEIVASSSYVDLFVHADSRWVGYVALSGSGTLIIRPASRGM